jgi:diaminopropionate ammonia-lyase
MHRAQDHSASSLDPDATRTSDYLLNPFARRCAPSGGLFTEKQYDSVRTFFRSLPEYGPTPLRVLGSLAGRMGIGELLIKDESSRMGLPAFKILGVLYAINRLIAEGTIHQGSVLTCATDGNHGRAVAHAARRYGLTARIFIHKNASNARVQAIADEGAEVTIVEGNYDDSVREATRVAETHNWVVVSDTAWPGYENIPFHIMAGYTMLMDEAAEHWRRSPDVVFVQAGVGGLACAVVSWLLHHYGSQRPLIVCCEPRSAACVLESIRAGKPQVIQGSLETIMAGLSCGTVSSLAWPVLRYGLDSCVSVTDSDCVNAIRQLAYPSEGDPRVVAGESGACSLAALFSVLTREDLRPVRNYLRISSDSHVFLINTEGATDPDSYYRATGLPPHSLWPVPSSE